MKEITSAGGIVTKKENGEIKLCLVELAHVKKGFIFPKGHIEDGENIQEAAEREVQEELGLHGVSAISAIKELGVVTRHGVERDGTELIKNIHIYLIKAANTEHTEAEEVYSWLTYEEALNKMEFDEEKAFLKSHWAEITELS